MPSRSSTKSDEPVQLYDDPRVVGWSKDFLAGKRQQVLTSVERDLRSDSPHPFAAHVWTVTQSSLGRLREVWEALNDDPLRRALGPLPDIYYLYDHGEYKKVLDEYPPSQAGEMRDLWSLLYLYYSANKQVRRPDELIYLLAAARLHPDFFPLTRSLTNLAYYGYKGMRSEVMSLVEPRGEFADTLLGRFLGQVLRYRPVDYQAFLAAVALWLEKHPLDAAALQTKGGLLFNRLERPETAVTAYVQSTAAYPFQLFWWDHSEALVQLGRVVEARQVAVQSAELFSGDADKVPPLVEQRMAGVLRAAGEKGRAREVLEAAREHWPDHAGLLRESAVLELESDRVAEALPHAQKVAELKPDNLADQVRLMEVLRRSGSLQEAFDLFQAVEERSFQKSTNLYWRGSQILAAQERDEERVKLCEHALAEYPGSGWMHRELADALAAAGRKAEAIARLQASFEVSLPSKWAVGKLRELCADTVGENEAQEELDKLRERFPWVQALWEEATSHVEGPGEVERKLGVWRQAVAANPGQRWPWRAMIDLLTDEKRWDEATRIADEALAAVQQGGPGDQSLAHFDRAIVPILRLRTENLDRQTLEQALGDLEAYRENGGYAAAYHQFRAEVMKALGWSAEAAESALAAARLRPDNYSLVGDLVTVHQDELGLGTVFAQAHRYLQRDPLDVDRLTRLIHIHVMWNGSPIRALQLIARLEKLAPDKVNSFHEAMAWGHLGDSAQSFTVRYNKSNPVARSDRYLTWYEGSRLRAQDETCQVELDYEIGRAKIRYPNGETAFRQDHPVSGRPVLLQRGPVFIRGEYDENGEQLLRVISSSGIEAHLSYHPNGKFQTWTVTRGDEMIRFDYDTDQRLIDIAREDVAGLKIIYNDAGERERVETFGDDAAVQTVREVALGFLNFILALMQSYSIDMPDIPSFTDPEIERLEEALDRKEEALRSEEPDGSPQAKESALLAVIKAAISLARCLIRNLDKDPDYVEEAGDILAEVFTYAQEPEASGPLIDLGIEAVALWHGLVLRAEKSGLLQDDYDRWSNMQRWLDEQVDRNPDNAPLRALIRQIGTQPLPLLESARWLPQSDLVNPGLWQHFPAEELLPSPLHPADINAILVRRNDEIVAGTAKGLCVLRENSWEWFGFDEARSRFSASLPPQEVGASSEVLALAEDEPGVLWIGTADGLVRLPSGYEDEGTRWHAADGALPAPRIEHLAPYKDATLVGTASGLYLFAPNGECTPFPAPLDEPITLLKAAPTLGVESLADYEDLPEYLEEDEPVWAEDDEEQSTTARPILVATRSALYGLVDDAVTQLLAGPVDGATWSPELRQVFILRHQQVCSFDWDGAGPAGRLIPLPGQQFEGQQIHGIDLLPLDDYATGVAVLTDRGLSIFRSQHFEHASVPPEEDEGAGVQAISSWGSRTCLVTSRGVHALERDQAIRLGIGRVFDLLVADDWGFAFVARGHGLQAVQLDDLDRGATFFDWISASHLAQDMQGRLVANDETTIIRYPEASNDSEVLFNATETLPQGRETETTGKITSLLAASDGSIWVTVGASAFCWRDGTVEEFSIFADPERFPARSDMISRVLETFDGRIWVVASNESHRRYQGMGLVGGLLEWTGSAFRRLPLTDESNHWFITGYTPIDAATAIVGTVNGFVKHDDKGYVHFWSLEHTSYRELWKRTPLLWLGTRGAKLDDGTWLVGTAGGVVAYGAGRWYYPEHMNWMLPDQHLREYGARAVHAVTTDKAGRVFAGTDRGLLIYDWSSQAGKNQDE